MTLLRLFTYIYNEDDSRFFLKKSIKVSCFSKLVGRHASKTGSKTVHRLPAGAPLLLACGGGWGRPPSLPAEPRRSRAVGATAAPQSSAELMLHGGYVNEGWVLESGRADPLMLL